ncbi:hypothetical protein XELAEV_18042152mg [Xenopus laevis]|uniref:Helix-turn-helix domain-containing protein n=1 Tax=Xenopus laevis TaxID=8355 RepID=A0A974C3I6_XENLA|nr:hypothetical protein XELAEV_18042152mg [Xenopus laevis]
MTTLYRKDFAANTILQASSSLPKHLIKNIPTGQFLRLRRLCSNFQDFLKQSFSLRDELFYGNIYHFQMQGIERVITPYRDLNLSQKILKQEVYWIFTLKTRLPKGMNSDFNVSCY